MTESRMNEVAQVLLVRSQALKVEWERTRSEDAYRVLFPDTVLRLSRQARGHSRVRVGLRYAPSDEGFDYRLDLADDSGRVIGSVVPAKEDPMHQVLADLFQLAEQYVQYEQQESGIDKVLDYLKRN